jgi:hypothetical protein
LTEATDVLKHVRGLGRREGEHLAQDQRGTLACREMLQRGDERQAQAVPVDGRAGRVPQVQQRVGHRLQPGDLAAVDERPERIAFRDHP